MKKIAKALLDRAGFQVQLRPDKQFDDVYNRFKEYTMIPKIVYCENLKLAQRFKDVPGDVVECGVWRGGMIGGLAWLLGKEKKYFLFDSFEGLPPAKEIDGEGAIDWQKNVNGETYFDNCKAEMSWAEKAMNQTGAPYQLVKGWFQDTLPGFNFDRPISILRLDGDWYDSTMECLQALYPRVAKGGVIIIDDYHTWDGCSRAVHDYLSRQASASRIHQTSRELAYIIKKD